MTRRYNTIELADLALIPGKRVERIFDVEVAPVMLSGETYHVVMGQEGVRVTVERVTGGFLVSLDFHASVFGPCFRCLKEATLELHPAQEEFVPLHPEEWDPTDLSPFIREMIVDVDSLVREALVLELPTKILCSETCPGVCPHCGSAAHSGPCEAEEAPIDPRWARLVDIRFENDDRG